MTSQPPGADKDVAPAQPGHGPLPSLLLLLTVVTGLVDAGIISVISGNVPGTVRA